MAIDLIDSALNTVAAHFDALANITARRGWPEKTTGMVNSQTNSLVTVTYVDHESVWLVPHPLNDPIPPGNLVQWKVADITIRAQLDLWCRNRVIRDQRWREVEAAMHNYIPQVRGLWLTQADYFSRPLTVTADVGRSLDDNDDANVGEWRAMWMLEIQTDRVVESVTPPQTTITIRPTVDGLLGPDKNIT